MEMPYKQAICTENKSNKTSRCMVLRYLARKGQVRRTSIFHAITRRRVRHYGQHEAMLRVKFIGSKIATMASNVFNFRTVPAFRLITL